MLRGTCPTCMPWTRNLRNFGLRRCAAAAGRQRSDKDHTTPLGRTTSTTTSSRSMPDARSPISLQPPSALLKTWRRTRQMHNKRHGPKSMSLGSMWLQSTGSLPVKAFSTPSAQPRPSETSSSNGLPRDRHNTQCSHDILASECRIQVQPLQPARTTPPVTKIAKRPPHRFSFVIKPSG